MPTVNHHHPAIAKYICTLPSRKFDHRTRRFLWVARLTRRFLTFGQGGCPLMSRCWVSQSKLHADTPDLSRSSTTRQEVGAVRVSIVIPAFNAQPTIERAIASARLQTEKRLEIIVVDDASVDQTSMIVSEAAESDARIRLLRLPTNAGPAAARNRGIAAAEGEWIALLDADDSYFPERISKLLELADQVGADMVADNILLCNADGHTADTAMIPPTLLSEPTELTTAEFISRNVGSPRMPRVSYGFLKPLLKASFLREKRIVYDERNRFAEDFMLYVRCLTNGARWWLLPEAMYRYAINPGSLTEQQSSHDLMRIRQMESELLTDPKIANDPVLVKAIHRHKSVLDRCYYYRAFTDAIKDRDLRYAAGLLVDSHNSAQLIVQEMTRQMPTILGKALRGGYLSHG
jgi:succinoglycan biosynthesis protein ExoO/succinoglycan biosynthesis protein ExoU